MDDLLAMGPAENERNKMHRHYREFVHPDRGKGDILGTLARKAIRSFCILEGNTASAGGTMEGRRHEEI